MRTFRSEHLYSSCHIINACVACGAEEEEQILASVGSCIGSQYIFLCWDYAIPHSYYYTNQVKPNFNGIFNFPDIVKVW